MLLLENTYGYIQHTNSVQVYCKGVHIACHVHVLVRMYTSDLFANTIIVAYVNINHLFVNWHSVFYYYQVSTTQTYSGRSWPNINTQQSYSTSQQYAYKQSSYIEASALSKQDGSIPLDAEGVQSLLVAENMFHQPTTGMKRAHNLTGLEQSLAAHTSVDNMDENNKFVCTECNKSND